MKQSFVIFSKESVFKKKQKKTLIFHLYNSVET